MTCRRTPSAFSCRALAWMALVASCAGLAAGCEEDHSVILSLHADFNPVLELTTLEVSVAASRTATGDRVCTPFTYTFNLDPGEHAYVELPMTIRIQPGATYNRILYVRVRGFLEGMLRLKMERMISLRGGEVTLDLELLEDCLGVATGRTQHCVNGSVVESPYWQIFEEGFGVESEPCVE